MQLRKFRNVAQRDRSATSFVSLFQIDLSTGFGSATIMKITHGLHNLLNTGSNSCGRTRNHSSKLLLDPKLRLSLFLPDGYPIKTSSLDEE
jgi:hypothetical protein